MHSPGSGLSKPKRRALLVVLIILLLSTGAWAASRLPFVRPFRGLTLAGIEGMEMIDDRGVRLALVTLAVSRGDLQTVQFPDESVEAFVKMTGHWIALTNSGPNSIDLKIHPSNHLLFLIPQDAQGCRVRLRFQSARTWYRCWKWLERSTPQVVRWLWRPENPIRPHLVRLLQRPPFTSPPRWKTTEFAVPLPKSAPSLRGESSAASP